MYLLNTDKVIAGFQAAKGCKEDALCLEESIDEEQFRIFLRIMKAEKASEIADISVEKIISLYECIGDFSKYFHEKISYAEKYDERFKSMNTVLLGRRIL